MRSSAADRAVDAGVAADGSGLIVVQSARGRPRSVRAVAFGARGRLGRPHGALGARRPRGLRRVGRRAQRRRGRRLVPPPRRALAPGGRDARARRRAVRPARAALGLRAPPVLHERVRLDRGARRRRRDMDLDGAPRGVGGAARRRAALPPRRSCWPATRATRRGPSSATAARSALVYSTQHVPLRAADGLQLRRAPAAGAFGPAEHVNPGGGVTIAGAAVTTAGGVLLAWRDQVHGARVHLSEAAPGQPLAPIGELGADVSAKAIAVAAGDDGRAVVAWSQRVSARRERVLAALRPPATGAPFAAPVALGTAWPAAEAGPARLVPGGGALVAWNAARFGRPAQRRSALLVTRVP